VFTVFGGGTLDTQAFKLASDTSVVTSHAVTVALPVGRASDQVVTVIQCGVQQATTFTTTADGVSVLLGAKRVTITTAQSVTVQ
jgi:hypothetical protein